MGGVGFADATLDWLGLVLRCETLEIDSNLMGDGPYGSSNSPNCQMSLSEAEGHFAVLNFVIHFGYVSCLTQCLNTNLESAHVACLLNIIVKGEA